MKMENPRHTEDERPINLLDPVLLGILPRRPRQDRHQRPDPEEMQQATIDLADAIEAFGTHETPDDGRREDGAAVGTGEGVCLESQP